MRQGDFNEIFRERTKKLAIEVINFVAKLNYSDAVSIIRKQLIRSVTSVAANFRATCRARSQREKYAKLCTVVEEADETLFWLEVLEETYPVEKQRFTKIYDESLEIVKVMAAYKKKVGSDL